MSNKVFDNRNRVLNMLLAAVFLLSIGCHSTRNLGDHQYLLRKNKIVLKSEKPIANKGELKDNLGRYIIQKPNSYFLGIFPVKLTLYNRRYDELHNAPDTSLPKSRERPVILDTSLIVRSEQNMKSYLFNQGYFYARIKDTFKIARKKAFATFTAYPGINYLIKNVNFEIADSNVAHIIHASSDQSVLQKGKEFTYSLLDDERSRITSEVRNNGYYRFTQENVNFINGLDTVDKTLFKDVESPFEGAVNFISTGRAHKKPTMDITGFVQLADDSLAFKTFSIGKVTVYPDYNNVSDLEDTNMIQKTLGDIVFKYHKDYVHAGVLYKHIYLYPGNQYSQADYDKTYKNLNELGIFQYIRIEFHENYKNSRILDCNIFLNRTKKYELSTLYELSSGSTYALGHSIGENFRSRDFLKGANLLTVGVNGGLEFAYNAGGKFINNFSILTESYGVNASLDFPKFLAPIASSLFNNSNLPHTIVGGGENVIDRVSYFTLINTSLNFSYSWRQTKNITWTLSPAFINIIRLPVETDSFRKVLDSNAYLRNSYKENFIEGENISFTFDNIASKHGLNYSYLKLGLEEAGSLLNGVDQLGVALNDLYKIQYAQYGKFDFDARHYFTLPHSVFAFRFYGGVGIPYGQSDALPYIKQYFSGGPYSLRGWRIRTLGPGSYYDINNTNNSNQIDRTGDIKLEWNGEYRFPIMPLFAGAVKMNGAIFADAGNIWLAHKDPSFPGGDFELNTLGQDIAADIGLGSRFDIASFLTLRLDIAMPVKKPYIFTNNGWVFNQIDPYSSTWRANNIIFNISIGYPF